MLQIRKNTFETNSSSTHSMVMCDDADYEGWSDGKLYYSEWFPYSEAVKALKKKDSDFYNEDEAKKICELAEIDWQSRNRREYFCTLEEFFDTEYLECEESVHVTKTGEKVHACYKYGMDN